MAPPCPIGTSAELRDGCYTGRCVTPEECAAERCEPGTTKPADDGCNTCFCSEDGLWACTKRACPDEGVCNRDGRPVICDVLPPECDDESPLVEVAFGCYTGACLTPEQCDRADVCEPGAVRPAGDDCNRCFCDDDGQWSCTEIACNEPCRPDECPNIRVEPCPGGAEPGARCDRDARGRCEWRIDACEPAECPDVGAYCRAQCDENVSIEMPEGVRFRVVCRAKRSPAMWRSAGRARVCPCAATVRDHSLRAYVRMMVPADGKLVNAHPTSVLRPTFIALRCVPAGPILTFRPDALHLSNALFAPDAPCGRDECGEQPRPDRCEDGAAPRARCDRNPEGTCEWAVDQCDPVCPDLGRYCEGVCSGRFGGDVPEGCPVPLCDCEQDGCAVDDCGPPPPLPRCEDGDRPTVECRSDDGQECRWHVECPPSEDECALRCENRFEEQQDSCDGEPDCERRAAAFKARCLLACQVDECPDVQNFCELTCNGEPTPDVPLGCPMPMCLCPDEVCRDAECGDMPDMNVCPDGQARDVRCTRGEDGLCTWHADECSDGCPRDGMLCAALCDGREVPPGCLEPDFCPRCPDVRCADDEFRCRDGACVVMEGRCDGRQTCRDGSDELGCPQDEDSSVAPAVLRRCV